jgi:hypothetical protein
MYPSILKPSSADLAAFSPPSKDKNVSFENLIINEFPIELGDNAPKTGAPIGMSRTACRRLVIDLEYFESNRPPRRHRSLIMTAEARTDRLLLAGHSLEEILRAIMNVHKYRASRYEVIRQASKQGAGLSKFVLSTGRILKNMIHTRGPPVKNPVKNPVLVALSA